MKEITKLIEYIKKQKYKHEIKDRNYTDVNNKFYRGMQVIIPELDFSAIWIYGSFGYESGLIEVRCKCSYYEGSVIGSLTAQECINILENYNTLKKLTNKRDKEIENSIKVFTDYYDSKISLIIQGGIHDNN